ncbi:hypothetical protein UCRPA7_6440 [Phaeoacremonium minimum UCRPA7]|uniref:S-adenosylmethionine-dependent methyltransferase-like protein n=1 Tax=Phaeoacremonium minimum (strain UCR-PA7) TaxID=1286976 RepID=R8BFL6_PHAM7|nr:hypothetical protein UCRPA7_6440 [Phaeoacremonium minimum UCRPA7]EON98082.1 hypothetical protein UCRPA7_6440 [Phaeoacremonium minimum UCRPA7]
MPFGRTGRQNRSQHSLVEPSAAGAGPPPAGQQSQIQTQQSAGPGGAGIPALSASSTESFDQRGPPTQLQPQLQSSQQQPPLPPAHGVNVFGPAGNQPPLNPNHQQPLHGHSQSVFDARQQKAAQDFADSVNRSQSQRYPQVTTPIHPQQLHPSFASSSVDDLPSALQAASSNIPQGQPGVPHHQQAPPPEPKRSTRRLIRNILSGNSGSTSTRDHYDNTGGLARRPSKRVSNPPAIRTGPSQVSLENQPIDWQHQGSHTQPSPLQGVGEFTDLYSVDESNHEHLQNPHEAQQSTIRRVNTNDHETSPYGPDDIGYRQQGHVQVQGQIPPELQQQFNQITFDPATQQYQFTTNSPQAQYPGGQQQQVYTAPSNATGNNPNYRQSTIQERPPYEGQGQSEGRNSPQPSGDAESDKAFKDLLTKYKNVKRLYFDGKTQIEQLNTQVEQLQNAVANQRMSQSRTALDDNEYSTRFNRLNGAINNLSFNIRKDWVSLPSWLDKYVSADALKTGKQEMTAVGRAVITRWVVDEIFDQCFHPALDPELSRQLKEIEHNIRRYSYTMNSQEEFDALTSKVISWRMATMIVELAVGIAANLSLESRDVAVTYPHPLDTVQPSIMDVEKTALPPIETRGDADVDDDEDSGKDEKGGKDRKSRAGMSTISNLLSNAPSSLIPGSGSRKGSTSSTGGQAGTDSAGNAALPPKDSNKVRFAGFMAVEVRGRQVLVKAPVWTLG